MSKNYDFQDKDILFSIILDKNLDAAKEAIEKGADITSEKTVRDLLSLAAKIDDFEMVKLLVERTPNFSKVTGTHTLLTAVHAKNSNIVDFLITKGVEFNIWQLCYNGALNNIDENDFRLEESLLKNCLDINEIGDFGGTVLMQAIRASNIKLIDLLIKNGANVNKLSSGGRRAIDFIQNNDRDLIKLLRENGSVEPKEPITMSKILPKLIISDNVASDSSALGNREKTLPILNKMLTKFPLTEREIDDTIALFKTTQDFTTYPAEYGTVAEPMTVLDVINKLSTMRDVRDRLPSWDFKKVLGIIIHIAKDDLDLTNNLIYTLSQIKMCDLSKLINLLYVVQDKIIESDKVDYSKIEFSEFEEVIERAQEEIKAKFGEKAPLAVIKWLNEHVHKIEITDPEKWCLYTQKVQGIFAKCFMEQQNIKVNIESYHFTDGLKNILILNMLDKIKLNSDEATTHGLREFKNLVKTGSGMLAAAYFDKILEGSVQVSDIDGAYYTFDLSMGDLEGLEVGTLKHYHHLISEKYGDDQGKLFLELLNTFILNSETKGYISLALNENNVEQSEQLIAVAPSEITVADVDTHLQGNIDQTDHHDFV